MNGCFILVLIVGLLITACTRKEWPIDHKIIEGKEIAIGKLTEARVFIEEYEKEKAFKRSREGLKQLEIMNRTKKVLRNIVKASDSMPVMEKQTKSEYERRNMAIFVERMENLSDLDVAEENFTQHLGKRQSGAPDLF